jgi:parvulin-like peptidyl-prolyl isomerase
VTRAPKLLLAASVLSVFALTGCGDGTVRTGAAATIGDERITTTTLDGYVERGLKDPTAAQKIGSDKAAFERSVLGRLLQHRILEVAGKEQGITVTGADIDAAHDRISEQLAQAGQAADIETAAKGVGIAVEDLDETLEDVVLRDDIADKLTASLQVPDSVLQQGYQQNIAKYDQVDSAHILVATKALADSLLAQVKADPTKFAALAQKYSTDDSSKVKGGELGFQGKGALVKEFEDAIFKNKPGSYVEVKTQFGFHVIHVEARRTTTFEQAKVELRREVLATQRTAALAEYLQKLAKKLGVHVNPRFGVWDNVQQDVVASTSCPSTAFTSPSPRPGDGTVATPEPSASPTCK